MTGKARSPVIASPPDPIRGTRQSSPDQARPSSAEASCEGTWNRRLACYRRLHARWKAEAETGDFRAANDEYYRACADLIARFGSWEEALRSRIGKPLCRAVFARVDAAENAYYERHTSPMQLAAARLLRTPVPEIDALLTKLEIILTLEVDTLDGTAPYPWDRLREDCRLLARTETGAR